MSEYGYVCENCQSTTNDEGDTVHIDKERRQLNTEGTAETLAKIHEIKTGHSPEVRRYS